MADVKEVAVIVAAGSGSRMGGDLPKQLQLLEGIPLAIHPGLQFRKYNSNIELVYVVQPGTQATWTPLLESHFPEGNWQLANGGASRFQSVRHGVECLSDVETLVAIHDGARPFISVKVLTEAFCSAKEKGSGVVAVPVKDSLREVADTGSRAVDRSRFFQVQTPQVFWLADLKKAYEVEDNPKFTDDATVMEDVGHSIHLVEGEYTNIKLTTPEDWDLARLLFPKIYPGL